MACMQLVCHAPDAFLDSHIQVPSAFSVTAGWSCARSQSLVVSPAGQADAAWIALELHGAYWQSCTGPVHIYSLVSVRVQ